MIAQQYYNIGGLQVSGEITVRELMLVLKFEQDRNIIIDKAKVEKYKKLEAKR